MVIVVILVDNREATSVLWRWEIMRSLVLDVGSYLRVSVSFVTSLFRRACMTLRVG